MTLKMRPPLSYFPSINLINTISMVVKIFGMCMERKVLEKLDRIRGDIPRAKFLSRLIERLEE